MEVLVQKVVAAAGRRRRQLHCLHSLQPTQFGPDPRGLKMGGVIGSCARQHALDSTARDRESSLELNYPPPKKERKKE